MKKRSIVAICLVSVWMFSCGGESDVNLKKMTEAASEITEDVSDNGEEEKEKEVGPIYTEQSVGMSPSLKYKAPFILLPKSISLPEGSGIEKLDFRQYSSRDMVKFIDFIASSSVIEEGLYFELEGGLEAAMSSLKSNPNVANVISEEPVKIKVDGIEGLKLKGVTTMNDGQKVKFQIVLFSKDRTTWQIVAQYNDLTADEIQKTLDSMTFEELKEKEG